jgi:hypothetical protein
MAQEQAKSAWFDESSKTPIIEEQARRLESFLTAVADGVVDESEVRDQEARLVALMREVEPLLDENLHAKVTQLLCELTAYDLMQTMHALHAARPKSVFRG